jgi:hypothetical protein
MYALAASAAGVGVLALAQSAEAKIVYTKTDKRIIAWVPFHLDLNHEGIADFDLKHYSSSTPVLWAWLYVGPGQAGNAFRGHKSSRGYSSASALSAGVRVGPKGPFLSGRGMMAADFKPNPGSWCNVTGRYLGLKFQIKGKAHFGWARLNVTCSDSGIRATLMGYAYETIPNKPIIAGKTHGKDVIMLQDASLGHLARGADAIKAWRSEK